MSFNANQRFGPPENQMIPGFRSPGQIIPGMMLPAPRPGPGQPLPGSLSLGMGALGQRPPMVNPRAPGGLVNPVVQSSASDGLVPTPPILNWGSGAMTMRPCLSINPSTGVPGAPHMPPHMAFPNPKGIGQPAVGIQPGILPYPPEIMQGQQSNISQQSQTANPGLIDQGNWDRPIDRGSGGGQDRGQRSGRSERSDRNRRDQSRDRDRSSDSYREGSGSSSRDRYSKRVESGPHGAILLDDRDSPSRDDRNNRDQRPGRSRGAILLDDRDPTYRELKPTSVRRGRSHGALLMDDRDTASDDVSVHRSVRGTILIDDRGQSNEVRGQRSRPGGALLLDDRDSWDRNQTERAFGSRQPRPSCDVKKRANFRDNRGQGHRTSEIDGVRGNSGRSRSRGGAILREDRDFTERDRGSRGHSRFSDDKDRRRTNMFSDGQDSSGSDYCRGSLRAGHRDRELGRPHRAVLRDDRGSDYSDSERSERLRGRSNRNNSSDSSIYSGRKRDQDKTQRKQESNTDVVSNRISFERTDKDKNLKSLESSQGKQSMDDRDDMEQSDNIEESEKLSVGGQGSEGMLSEGEIDDGSVLSDAEMEKDLTESETDSTRKRRLSDDGFSESEKRARLEDNPPQTDEELNLVAENNTPSWLRSSPADLYFTRDIQTGCMVSTKKMRDLEDRFQYELVERAARAKTKLPAYEPPKRRPHKVHFHHGACGESSSGSSSESEEETEEWLEELKRKQKHPHRLHQELWYNDRGEVNDGPLCRCSLKSRKSGIRHNIFPGEQPLPQCDMTSNSQGKLFHYRITFSPATNFLAKQPTIIEFDNHEYIFEGFSLFTHTKIPMMPQCKVVRFNILYTIHLLEEKPPEAFSIRSLDLFTKFLFNEILELVDIDWRGPAGDDSCNRTHLMPRFARSLPENGTEILSMNEVLSYLLRSTGALIKSDDMAHLMKLNKRDWQVFVDDIRGMVVTHPGKKPSSLRIDQLDRDQKDGQDTRLPLIIHHGLRPAQLSYAGNPEYKKKWREYIKFRHLMNGWPKVSTSDKEKLKDKEDELQKIRIKSSMKREVTVEIGSEGFLRTGIRSDICQHAMMLPVLLSHLRFHDSLTFLEDRIGHRFKDRGLLQLALTHSSYKVNYGTNPDHVRNSLSNCGSRQVEFGDQNVHYIHTRKKGLTMLMSIMSKMGQKMERQSEIPHNERLEFLGDAVIEFISSTHLFYMFPWLDEGELTTFRGSLVQNQHLAILAKKLHLQDFMLYAHGPDLCHESDFKHAMANCFEAFMGALFIDGGIELADRLFSETLFEESDLLEIWTSLPKHPLQEDEPGGDRHWIASSPTLQKLLKFEEMIGVEFTHIRLLARCFSQRNIGYNNLTLGHNQRLEFLGDTIIQLISSEYLFKHFPDHHEGHLSLLRSSLVNNRNQAKVGDELGLAEFVITAEKSSTSAGSDTQNFVTNLKMKDKADLLEAFLGALYVDQGLDFCKVICEVCFFPRLEQFILNQDWSDPKSQLQQCCLTLREMNGEDPDIPTYKVIQKTGPTNTRKYQVAVYFRGKRLAIGIGQSIQQAEMEAASKALYERHDLFPILLHQRRFLLRNKQRWEQEFRELAGSSSSEMTPPLTSSPKKPFRDQQRTLGFKRAPRGSSPGRPKAYT